MRVLLVDDDAGFLDAVTALLETVGGLEIVGRAGDGEAAVAETARLRPDVVVMDLDMPRLGGVEATRLIRELLPESKVVILSGSEVVAHAAPSLAAGAIAYVRKSNTVDDLPTVLESLR
jgi:two-component system nitrate/nitrite response regulator NarL